LTPQPATGYTKNREKTKKVLKNKGEFFLAIVALFRLGSNVIVKRDIYFIYKEHTLKIYIPKISSKNIDILTLKKS
jgi:hypothetical protein